MSPAEGPVKGRRGYDASGRRERAARTRARLLAAAGALFLARGYAATTVAAVASSAGVSVETVYKAYGGKAGLVRALRDEALRGAAAVPAEERSDAMARATDDPRAIVHGWAELTGEVMPRVAPVLLLVRAAAATDAEMAAVHRETEDARLTRMAGNAARLGPHLRPGVTAPRARDVLFTYSAPELYELLVLRQQWPLADYLDFVERGITGALLGPG